MGPEQPSQGRLDAQHPEVRARDVHRAGIEGLAVVGKVHPEGAVRRQPGQHPLPGFEVAVHRIAEHLVAAAGPVAGGGAELRAWSGEVDQLFGMGDRQRTEQDPLEHREDGGIGADPERQRAHGHQRDERRPGQGADGKLEIGHARPTRANATRIQIGTWAAGQAATDQPVGSGLSRSSRPRPHRAAARTGTSPRRTPPRSAPPRSHGWSGSSSGRPRSPARPTESAAHRAAGR